MTKFINPIDQLIHSTLRIECDMVNGCSSGSGYILGFLDNESDKDTVPCIVTNKHVINGAQKGKFHVTPVKDNGQPDLEKHFPVFFEDFESLWIKHPDPEIDLAIFPLGPILHQLEEKGIKIYCQILPSNIIASKELLDMLPTMEDIIMIGYPNGIWDKKHNLPIIRKGITATHPKLKYDGRPEFMIDAACFPGSSGSPVFLANMGSFMNPNGDLCAGVRIALLGTLYAGPQHTAEGRIEVITVPVANIPIALSSIPNNLGMVIHSSVLKDFEPILEALMKVQNMK